MGNDSEDCRAFPQITTPGEKEEIAGTGGHSPVDVSGPQCVPEAMEPALEQRLPGLKANVVRGGLARVVAQAAAMAIRMGSLVLFARLLQPEDFGLVGMVAAVTGVLSVFQDFGLSTATVQQAALTEEQSSTLFWLNLLLGAVL